MLSLLIIMKILRFSLDLFSEAKHWYDCDTFFQDCSILEILFMGEHCGSWDYHVYFLQFFTAVWFKGLLYIYFLQVFTAVWFMGLSCIFFTGFYRSLAHGPIIYIFLQVFTAVWLMGLSFIFFTGFYSSAVGIYRLSICLLVNLSMVMS